MILRINLTNGEIESKPVPRDLKLRFIGGSGINAKILYDEVEPEIDPFDPENRLIFGAGPLSGTTAPATGRISATTKCPFTFAFTDSSAGGSFGAELRRAGYEHIVISGKSENLSYLLIDDERAELRNAEHLAMKDVFETDEIIKREIGDPKINIAAIGPAGENLVRYACVVINLNRALGWGGIGAVMGSKNLKAIVVRARRRKINPAASEEFAQVCTKVREMIKKGPRFEKLRRYGRVHNNELCQALGVSGAKNLSEGIIPQDQFLKIESETFVKEVLTGLGKNCFNCPVGCTHYFLVKDGPYAGTEGSKIEYNHVCDAKVLGIYNTKFVAKWALETNRLGLDTDGPAYAISWAMECFEKGILTEKDTGGQKVSFGNEELALELLNTIAYRKGEFPTLLGEGQKIASEKIGKGSERYAMHIKGARLLMDNRWGYGVILAHAVATRGADHLKGMPGIEMWPFDEETKMRVGEELFRHQKAAFPYEPEGKGNLVKWYEDFYATVDAIGMCKTQTQMVSLTMPGCEEFAELISSLRGEEITGKSLMMAGERIINVERSFNAKCGLDRKQDTYPFRFFEEPNPHAPIKMIDRKLFEKMKDDYYAIRGWDIQKGTPTQQKLEELGLQDIANDLEKHSILPKAPL